jgi:uncharacterized protein (DUF2267 family)
MHLAPFLTTVEQTAGISREQASRAVTATLRTLAERISGGEAREVALFLPAELRPLLDQTPELAEGLDFDDFLRRVAEREGVDRRTALEHARAVFVALGVAVAPGELRDMAAQLPKEFEPLLEAAGTGRGQAIDEDPVVRLAHLTGLERERARQSVEAVLEALAVRISAGEVEDLAAELPAHLRPALEHGLRESRTAVPMSADEFVARVARREGVGLEQAREHARAVFSALRETVSSEEFSDMAAQLSDDYAPLLAGVA